MRHMTTYGGLYSYDQWGGHMFPSTPPYKLIFFYTTDFTIVCTDIAWQALQYRYSYDLQKTLLRIYRRRILWLLYPSVISRLLVSGVGIWGP